MSGFDDIAVAYKAPRLVGIVGYTPVLDSFPLGKPLVDMLRHALPPDGSIAIENMSWGPIHIVQRFQDPAAMRPERLVLVGAASTSAQPGCVRAFRWKGGKLPEHAVQERIYEAVTGIVDIENTLVIGEFFGIWPQECFVVEADMPGDTFGRLAIAESEKWPAALTEQHLGFSPGRLRQEIGDTVAALALRGAKAQVPLEDKIATPLARDAMFAHHNFVSSRV